MKTLYEKLGGTYREENGREIFAYTFKLGARLMLAVVGEKDN